MRSAAATKPYRHVQRVMGTVVTMDLYPGTTTSEDDIPERFSRAHQVLARAERVFSTWEADSPMSRLRRGELSIDEAPPEIATILALCAHARRTTGGWFDPWAMAGGVDPTGLVKGWAAQLALGELSSDDILGAMVNAAGDIACTGRPSPDALFRVGIVDPHAPGRLACVVELCGAIATSGTYERGDHLIDPRSGRPASGAASASVTGPDLAMADALATALAVAGTEGLALVESLEGCEALIISPDASVHFTENFPFASTYPVRGPL
jgi:FAD:protein FMN transferase